MVYLLKMVIFYSYVSHYQSRSKWIPGVGQVSAHCGKDAAGRNTKRTTVDDLLPFMDIYGIYSRNMGITKAGWWIIFPELILLIYRKLYRIFAWIRWGIIITAVGYRGMFSPDFLTMRKQNGPFGLRLPGPKIWWITMDPPMELP